MAVTLSSILDASELAQTSRVGLSEIAQKDFTDCTISDFMRLSSGGVFDHLPYTDMVIDELYKRFQRKIKDNRIPENQTQIKFHE